jgi:APA family basic amino acid/polyamine antiporter
MVGTGVFTSLGFQAAAIQSPFALIMLWVVGGAYALCGALAYGELGAAIPRSGGEYRLLSEIYHPSVGFLAGWVSVTVGFAAPVAAACMALGSYLSRVFPALEPRLVAVAAATLITAVHLWSLQVRKGFQNAFTLFKIALICGFVLCAFLLAKPQPVSFWPDAEGLAALLTAPFAVSLVFVTYAYSGWNAAVYIADEVRDPGRTIPRSLLLGTLLVTVLYVLLNFAFLWTTPVTSLAGQLEVGFLSGESVFGPPGARIVGLLISLSLVSSISSMVWAGPRVLLAVGEDFTLFRALSPLNRHGVPHRAVLIQYAVALGMVLTSTFESVITYLGFTLAACTFLTVSGVFVHRWRRPGAERPYRTWGYPATPLFFLTVTAWMLAFLLIQKPMESLAGLATLALGLPVYFLGGRRREEKS